MRMRAVARPAMSVFEVLQRWPIGGDATTVRAISPAAILHCDVLTTYAGESTDVMAALSQI